MLRRVVARSVGQRSTDIGLFTKITEGSSYRIFEATFRDGSKVIARHPYPSNIPRKYGIASEVATIEFLHMHGIPIPKIFNWSLSASNNIGSKYIIIERAQGRELADTWYAMTFKDRMAIIEKIVEIERILFGIQFPASGSLFFKNTLDPGVRSWIYPKTAVSKVWIDSV
jgi:aminoglycoside phosphotransferase (APT) family kinase protein